ncbi:MAG: hypothetical protein RIB84_12295 [Sneathiellaceae bacterium]
MTARRAGRVFRPAPLAAIALALAACLGHVAPARAANHLLAIAACPPWIVFAGEPAATRLARRSCAATLDTIVGAVTARLDVEPAHATRLLDAAATSRGVTAALADLAGRLGPDDRLYVYVNAHGGRFAGRYKGYPVEDEALAFWTPVRPDSDPVGPDGFMFVKTLRDLILAVPAGQTVIVLDSCESGLGFADFRFEPDDLVAEGRRAAVVFSSRPDQIAHFTADGRQALFTRKLALALELFPGQRLVAAVRAAAVATHDEARAVCALPGPAAAIGAQKRSYRAWCAQQPYAYDPYGVLDAIAIAGTAAPAGRDGVSSSAR